MGANRIEGAAWHSLPDTPAAASEGKAGAARFSLLMSQDAAGSSGVGRRRITSNGQYQRYRLIGGNADGMVCEIGEREGEVCLKVLVPHYGLFMTLTQLSSWLSARLRESGHSLVLEVEYVEGGDDGKIVGHDSHGPRGAPHAEKPSS